MTLYMWLVVIVSILTIFLYLVHKYTSRNYEYWAKRKVPFIKPKPIFGNFWELATLQKSIGTFLEGLYNEISEPFFGIYIFCKPCLIVRCPKLIRSILINDFSSFPDRTAASCRHDSLVHSMLFFSNNPLWKDTRKLISPLFASGKLKEMFPLINNTGDEMNKYIAKHLREVVNCKEICSKFSTDVIAKCAFSIDAYSFEEEGDFEKNGAAIFEFSVRNAISQISYFFLPQLVKWFRLTFMPKAVNEFLTKVFSNTIKEREESEQKNNDLIDIILELRNNKEFIGKYNFDGPMEISQAAQFFLAGFETTSSTMSYTLYQLSIHPKIQQKLRAEISCSIEKHNGITYEGLQEMTYLHMCVSETLRMYPVLPFLDRLCTKDYQIPGTEVTIEKGTPIYIPMFGLHYDPAYFPYPKNYNPDRFKGTSINKEGLAYLPFGEGPRKCIGERFGMMSTKLGLAKILSEYEVFATAQTPIPLIYEPKSFVLASRVGLPVKFRKCECVFKDI